MSYGLGRAGGSWTHLNQLHGENSIICTDSGNPERVTAILGHDGRKVLLLDSATLLTILNRSNYLILWYGSNSGRMWNNKHFSDNDSLLLILVPVLFTIFMDSDKKLLEGCSHPCLKMRFKAMNSYTQSLPLIEELPDDIPDVAQTTTESMLGGVIWGIAGKIEEFLSIYSEKYHDLKVLFWGGGAIRFESMVKGPTFAAPNLVLVGLNSILRHNNEVYE